MKSIKIGIVIYTLIRRYCEFRDVVRKLTGIIYRYFYMIIKMTICKKRVTNDNICLDFLYKYIHIHI